MKELSEEGRGTRMKEGTKGGGEEDEKAGR